MKLYSTTQGIARETADGRLEILELDAADLGALLAEDPTLDLARNAVAGTPIAADVVQLRAPVPNPGSVFCVGANYQSHLDEVKTILGLLGDPDTVAATLEKLQHTPMFFSVPSSAVSGPHDPIVLPAIASEQVDYEIEVAVIVGRGGKNIAPADVPSRVAGLTLANDVSARDIQTQAMREHSFEFGHAKGLDGFKPMGPCLVTMDEFSSAMDMPIDMAIEAKVNGETRQLANLSQLIHDIPRCVSYISTFHSLRPGDVILTGSPAGVGFFQGKFLKPGDVVEMTADGIGELRNPVVAESND